MAHTHTQARAIIARSILMHPSLFTEALRSTARMHLKYALDTPDAEVSNIAVGMANDCTYVAVAIEQDDMDGIMATVGRWTSALLIAGKLQCLPRHVVHEAADGEA